MRFLAGMVERVDGCADVTTRANLQLRGMGIEECEEVFMGLYDIGLTSVQSGMDNVRNMTGNPIAGIDPHELASGAGGASPSNGSQSRAGHAQHDRPRSGAASLADRHDPPVPRHGRHDHQQPQGQP